ncbi:hypothetical protein GCM10027605_74280 [Micromonospora zhanjiangensis]
MPGRRGAAVCSLRLDPEWPFQLRRAPRSLEGHEMSLFRRAPQPTEILAAARLDDAEDAAKARQRLIEQAAKDTEHRAPQPTCRIGGNP